jgi:hypothetical protein
VLIALLEVSDWAVYSDDVSTRAMLLGMRRNAGGCARLDATTFDRGRRVAPVL